jgi:hypothetical protein
MDVSGEMIADREWRKRHINWDKGRKKEWDGIKSHLGQTFVRLE